MLNWSMFLSSSTDPYETKLEDWIVFQYLHWKHVQQRLEVPVTIQLAPFANVSYNVSLMRCQDDCSNLALTDNKTFDGPTRYLKWRDKYFTFRYGITEKILRPHNGIEPASLYSPRHTNNRLNHSLSLGSPGTRVQSHCMALIYSIDASRFHDFLWTWLFFIIFWSLN